VRSSISWRRKSASFAWKTSFTEKQRLLREEIAVSTKYAFIASEEDNYPMQLMLRCAKVSKSGFYEWKDRGPSETTRPGSRCPTSETSSATSSCPPPRSTRASIEAKRKALEAAYPDIIPNELPEWNQDIGLLGWLANL
jgi:hypothetical protein